MLSTRASTILALLVIWLSPSQAFGQLDLVSPESAADKTIAAITVQGLSRTKESVVQRELLIREKQPLKLTDLSESIVRLKNLRIFSEVNVSLYLDEQQDVYIVIHLQEVWTTIPIVKFASGGDTTYFVAGAYDINVLGKYLELGAQYESWNSEPGGVVWFREPRFLNKRLRFGGDLWSVKRPHDLLEPDGQKVGSYVLYTRRLNLFFDSELSEKITAGVGAEVKLDKYIGVDLSGAVNDPISQQLANDEDSKSVLARAYIKLGRLDYDNYLLHGALSEFTYSGTLSASDENYYHSEWDNRIFWRLFSKSNLGARLRFAATNSDELRDLYYIGGFENVRGYLDGQLRGKRYWQSNIEFRTSVYQWRWLVLQSNVFFDVAQLINPTTSIESNNDDIFHSVGLGLRLISPNVYRFVGRLDLAVDTSHPATSRFSFGVQQFF